MLDMLGIATPRQTLLRRQFRTGPARRAAWDATLTEFFAGEATIGEIETMLLDLTDRGRLYRGRAINDVEILRDDTDLLVADVAGYSIFMDYNERFILHDCQDWRQGIGQQRLCKHVVALILALPPGKGRVLLDLIRDQHWDFRPYTG